MQCVILAAGEGRRLRPLTNERPKPLVSLAGRPLLDHIAEALPSAVTEIVLVVGYRGQDIVEHCGENYFDRPVRYFWQREANGNALALQAAETALRDRFFVLFADDLIDRSSLETALRYERAILASRHDQPQNFGVIATNPDGSVAEILEKPANPPSNLVCTSASLLDRSIFEQIEPAQPNRESYLSRAIAKLAKIKPIMVSPMRHWYPIGWPEDLARAEDWLARQQSPLLTNAVEVS